MLRRYPNNLLRLIFISVALGHGVALQAQPPSVQTPINLKPDIVYKTTAEGDLQMDLYYPASELVGAYPLVVYTHGGGWAAGSKKKAQVMSRMGGVVRGLTEAGFCVAAVNYRLCNKGDTRIRDCVTDAMDAVRYLAKHGEKLHIDPTRVFTFGDSAGGQLAQMLLLAPTNAFPGAAELAGQRYTMVAGVSWYGPCDFEKTELFNPDGRPNFRDRFGSRLLKPETRPSDQLRFYREVSPINYLRKDGPPLLMIQGDKDTTIPVHHAYYMQEKAKACSAPVEILIVKNAGHCWGKVDAPIEPPLNDIVKRTVDFLAADGGENSWRIDTAEEWKGAAVQMDGLAVHDGLLAPTGKQGVYRSNLKRFAEKRSAKTMTLTASAKWENWEPTTSKVAPPTLGDAPIFLVKGPGDYWLLGRNSTPKNAKAPQNFKAESATLAGFDVPLQTTPYPLLFDAPGGLKKSLGGYHAWQSRDMVNWVHHGPVTAEHAKWATTAEFVDGKAYIYYDFPNDQDPHLYIDEDLTDGKPGKDMGLAFKDPSDGSDCAFIRDLDGKFHVIYEDWSPIDAGKHSWDSPLAGHAVSADGKGDFKILPPAVDERTKPTGRFAEYPHPHWHREDPLNYPGKTATVDVPKDRIKAGSTQAFARYEIHEPEQNAFGDWAAIAIGGQYYLVSDYHPAHDKIRIGLFTSPSLDQKFEFIGEIGSGHPDPDIGFAEGKFYLINQTRNDYVSPGPWGEKVAARVGVDTTNDGVVDIWSDWQELKEQYDYIKGFSKQVKRIPASMELSKLPAGYGFCFELRMEDTTASQSKPMLDSVEIRFR